MKLFKRILLTAAVLGFSITLPAGAMFDDGNNNNNPFTTERQTRSTLNLTGMQGTESAVVEDIENLSRQAVLNELNRLRALIQQVANVLPHNNGNAPITDDADDISANAPVDDEMEAPEIVPLFESNNNNLQIAPVAPESTLVKFFNKVTHDERAQQLIKEFDSNIFKRFLVQHKFDDTLENRITLLPSYIITLQKQFRALPATSSSTASRIEVLSDKKFIDLTADDDSDSATPSTTIEIKQEPSSNGLSTTLYVPGVTTTQFSGSGSDDLSETQKQAAALEAENAELERQLQELEEGSGSDGADAQDASPSSSVTTAPLLPLPDAPAALSSSASGIVVAQPLQPTTPGLLEQTTQLFRSGFDNVRKFIRGKRKVSADTNSQSSSPSFLDKAKEKAIQCFNNGVAKARKVRERIKRSRSDEDGDLELVREGKRVKKDELPVVQHFGSPNSNMIQITKTNGPRMAYEIKSLLISFDKEENSLMLYTWNSNYTLNTVAKFPLDLATLHVTPDVLKNSNAYSADPERGIDLNIVPQGIEFLDHQTQNVLARFTRQSLNPSQYGIINTIYNTAMNNLGNVALAASPIIYSALSFVHPAAPLAVVAYDIYKIADNVVKVVKKQ